MNTRYWLIAILVLAAVLRLWGLERGDPMNDEITYAFRAIGPVDSFNDPAIQSTPWEWFDPNIPAWAKISFHDHPPLVFWIQHLAMRIFGETLWAARLPSAIFGIASIGLLYLLAARLYTRRVGLLASAILAVTLNHVFISRTGQQEAYVIFFLLAALYFLKRSLANERWLLATGAALGLGLMTKLTAVMLIPILLVFLLLFKRQYFRSAWLWMGAGAALAIAGPIILYNFKLYQAVGHFDFQFSYLFGQHPAVWPKAPGKDIGTVSDRIGALLPRLIASHSWLFLAVFAASAAAFLQHLPKHFRETLRAHALLLTVFGSFFLLFLVTGTAARFLTPLTPFLAIAAAVFLTATKERLPPMRPVAWRAAIVVFLAFEAFYTINNQIAFYPRGPSPWLSSPLRYENHNWGYNALDDYLARELNGKVPALTFETERSFIRDLQNADIAAGRKRGDSPYPALIITYGDFDLLPELWTFDRRLLYHGWPIITLDEYRAALENKGPEVYRTAGFRHFYFILRSNIAPSAKFTSLVAGIRPTPIANPRGEEVFRVYQFE